MISELAWRALTQSESPNGGTVEEPAAIYGFRPFPARGVVVTDEKLDQLRDDEAI